MIKNIVIALSSLLTTSAYAELTSGFYTGVSGSYIHSSAHHKTRKTAAGGGTVLSFNKSLNSNHAGFGVYTGYGYISDWLFVSGELGYEYEPRHFQFHKTINGTNSFKSHFSRFHNFNGIMRVGVLFDKSTAGYITGGVNYGKYHHKTYFTDKTGVQPSITTSHFKWHHSFKIGAGVERALTSNVLARLQWTYDFGPNIKKMRFDTLLQPYHAKLRTLRVQKLTVGVAYKF